MLATVWLCCSTIPFYCGVYGVINCRRTPCSTQCLMNWVGVNLPPLSEWKAHSLRPISALTTAWYYLIATAATSLLCSTLIHMNWLRSSTCKIKYRLPLGVIGVTRPQMSHELALVALGTSTLPGWENALIAVSRPETPGAKLIDVFNLRHASHQPLPGQLIEC
jgi:hypothetical protein